MSQSSLSRYLNQSRNRVRVSRDSLHLNRSPVKGVTYPALVAENVPVSVFLVGKRPPLAQYPALWRLLARFIYRRIHWCPDFGIEYQGIYTDESEARFAASAPGMFYMELPLNASLPEEACQYGRHDFPLSEASPEYRHRQSPFIAVRRETAANVFALEEELDQLEQRLEPECVA